MEQYLTPDKVILPITLVGRSVINFLLSSLSIFQHNIIIIKVFHFCFSHDKEMFRELIEKGLPRKYMHLVDPSDGKMTVLQYAESLKLEAQMKRMSGQDRNDELSDAELFYDYVKELCPPSLKHASEVEVKPKKRKLASGRKRKRPSTNVQHARSQRIAMEDHTSSMDTVAYDLHGFIKDDDQ